jgi:hypothetical protein
MGDLVDPDAPAIVTNSMLAQIIGKCEYLEAALAELQQGYNQKLDEAGKKISSLQSMVIEQDNRIKELESRPINSSKVHEPKMPDPPMFTGERKDVLPFLAKCRLKFEGQPSMFPTERTKVMYAGSRLEGPPFSWFTPLNERFGKRAGSLPQKMLTSRNGSGRNPYSCGEPPA